MTAPSINHRALTPTPGPAAASPSSVSGEAVMPSPIPGAEPLLQALDAHPGEHQARFLAAMPAAPSVAGDRTTFPFADASRPADVDGALRLRGQHFDAGAAVADELIAQLSLALGSAPDAQTRNRLQTAISGLQQFKADLRTQQSRDAERSQRLRNDERQAAKAADRKRLVQEALHARAALRFETGRVVTGRLSDSVQARMQAALVAQTAARGGHLDLPVGPMGVGATLATHLAALLRPAALPDAAAADLLSRIRGKLAALG